MKNPLPFWLGTLTILIGGWAACGNQVLMAQGDTLSKEQIKEIDKHFGNLWEEHGYHRASSTKWLSEHPEARPDLRHILQTTEDSWQVSTVLRILGHHHDLRDLPLIDSILCHTTIELGRGQAGRALALHATPEAMKLLMVRSFDPEVEIASSAAYALGFYRHDAARQILEIHLENPQRDMRLAAVNGLGNMGEGKSLKKLLKLLATEKDSWIRQRIVRSWFERRSHLE